MQNFEILRKTGHPPTILFNASLLEDPIGSFEAKNNNLIYFSIEGRELGVFLDLPLDVCDAAKSEQGLLVLAMTASGPHSMQYVKQKIF